MSNILVELHVHHGEDGAIAYNALEKPLRFLQSDSDIAVTSNLDAITAPSNDTPVYTYVKNFRLYLKEAPEGLVTNFRVYLKPRPEAWRGIDIFMVKSSEYVDATVFGANPLDGFANNANSYTRDNPLELSTALYSDATPGSYGPWIQLQARVTKYAEPGVTPYVTLGMDWEQWYPL